MPILHYGLGQPEKVAIAGSLFVVGTVSLVAAVPQALSGRVRWRVAALFGVPGMAGTFGGAALSRWVPGPLQLGLFALVMLLAAGFMFRSPRPRAAGAPGRPAWKVGADGLGVGLLTGLVGVGGGFLIVPALVLLGGLEMHAAVGTSLAIIAAKSFAGFLGYGQVLRDLGLDLDWTVLGVFAGLGVAGSLLGGRLGARVPQVALRRTFSVVLVVMAVGIMVAELVPAAAPAEAPTETAPGKEGAATLRHACVPACRAGLGGGTMARMVRIECVIDCGNYLGEGPVWDPEEARLYWVDSKGPSVARPALWRLDPARGEIRNWELPKDVGALALRREGGAVLALADGFYLFDFETGRCERVHEVDVDRPRVRLNDGKVDRAGRFFAGGMDEQEELPLASLWRLDADLSLTRVDEGIICSNGPCWSPDDRIFYFADSFRQCIYAYDYDIAEGTLRNRRVWASTEDEPGVADGSTVDEEGCVWNAQVIAGQLVRYAPDGSVLRRIEMPVRNVTSVMFGGDRLDELYVTSMARVVHAEHGLFRKEAAPEPGAGGLFRVTGLGVRGLPEPRFAG